MDGNCPTCGAAGPLEERTARVLRGSCSACGQGWTVLPEALATGPGPGSEPGAAASAPPDSAGEGAPVPAEGPTCGSCGAVLSVRSASETTLVARCSSCRSTFSFELVPPGRPTFRRGSREGPSRDRGAPPGGRARPCRECGGPLRFTTGPDGVVTGECGSCGNRFTLPPRREFGGRGREFSGRPGRGFSGGYDRPRRWSRDDRGGGGPPRARPRRRESHDDEDDDERRPRRRPRE